MFTVFAFFSFFFFSKSTIANILWRSQSKIKQRVSPYVCCLLLWLNIRAQCRGVCQHCVAHRADWGAGRPYWVCPETGSAHYWARPVLPWSPRSHRAGDAARPRGEDGPSLLWGDPQPRPQAPPPAAGPEAGELWPEAPASLPCEVSAHREGPQNSDQLRYWQLAVIMQVDRLVIERAGAGMARVWRGRRYGAGAGMARAQVWRRNKKEKKP